MQRHKIYTRKGDQGETSLLGGKRVSKGTLRIEIIGSLDELNSFLGLFLALWEKAPLHLDIIHFLTRVQNQLFVIGSQLAAPPGTVAKVPELQSVRVQELEEWIDRLDEQCLPLEAFILPGGHVLASWAHVLRGNVRRVERSLVNLKEDHPENLLPYLNRLSDFFFVLARFLNKEFHTPEIKWDSRS